MDVCSSKKKEEIYIRKKGNAEEAWVTVMEYVPLKSPQTKKSRGNQTNKKKKEQEIANKKSTSVTDKIKAGNLPRRRNPKKEREKSTEN